MTVRKIVPAYSNVPRRASQVAFHTAAEEDPWATIDLGEFKQVNGLALPLILQRASFLGN